MQEAQNYGQKKIRRARLSNGDELDVEVAVVALSTLRNTEWLQGANLAADARGVPSMPMGWSPMTFSS